MTEENSTRQHLLEIFSLANRNSLPAMASHVTRLLFLLSDNTASAEELTAIILEDYALTSKILRMANSAYYSKGIPITTISRAVIVLGLDVLRQLAATTALFELFIATGADKEEIAKTFALSLLSAIQSRLFCELKRPDITPEEAYICTLLHHIGAVIVLVYLPHHYRTVAQKIREGYSEEHSCRLVLNGLTYSQIGQEMATFWGFPKRIIACMETTPPENHGKNQDSFLFLHNLVVFNNRLTTIFFQGSDLDLAELLLQFGPSLHVNHNEALELVDRSIRICETFTGDICKSLEEILNNSASPVRVKKDPAGHWVRQG